MSIKDAEKFLKQVSEDQKLRKIALDLYQRRQMQSLEKMAKQRGCEFTFEELTTAFQKEKSYQEELSDAELELLAAGKYKSNRPEIKAP